MRTATITPASYHGNEGHHRALADRIMERYGYDPADVFRIRVNEASATVWAYDNPRRWASIDPHGPPAYRVTVHSLVADQRNHPDTTRYRQQRIQRRGGRR